MLINNKMKFIYEDGRKILKIPFSYENNRNKLNETLYDKGSSYHVDRLYGGTNLLSEEEFIDLKNSIDSTLEIYGRKKNILHKKCNDHIEIFINGIKKSSNKVVTIRVVKVNNYFGAYKDYVTTVERLKSSLIKVYKELKIYEEEIGNDFTSKLTCETIFM